MLKMIGPAESRKPRRARMRNPTVQARLTHVNDSAAPRLTQWGTPQEWWDASAYPKSDVSLAHWAWEFLRRNPDFRAFWRDHVAPYYDAATHTIDEKRYREEVLEPAQHAWEKQCARDYAAGRVPVETTFRAEPLRTQMEERFGACADPCRSDCTPAFAFQALPSMHPWPTLSEDALAALKRKSPYPGQLLTLSGNEVAIIFNTRRPIDPQIEQAKRLLRALRPRNAKDARPQVKLYREYLQVLDAAELETPLPGIAATLFPNDKDEYPDYPVTHRVRNYLTAATKLRDGGYRQLAAADNPAK
jgi:hypothetical protein